VTEPLNKHSPVIVDDYVDDYGGPSIQCEVESCGIRSRDWYLHFAPLLDHVDCPSCGGQGWVAEMTADPTPSGEPGEPYQVQVACEDSWHQMVVAAVDAAGGVFWDETAHVVAPATPTPDTRLREALTGWYAADGESWRLVAMERDGGIAAAGIPEALLDAIIASATSAPDTLDDAWAAAEAEQDLAHRSDIEWLVWFARKTKGKAADVAREAMDQNPGLRAALAATREEMP